MTIQQSDIDALTEALASGERMVRKGDRTVEYRSVAEIVAARDRLIAEKARQDAEAAGTTVPRQYRIYHAGKGC